MLCLNQIPIIIEHAMHKQESMQANQTVQSGWMKPIMLKPAT